MTGLRSLLAKLLSSLVTSGLFRGFDVAGDPTRSGPRLVVANHFNGLVDAVVLVRALGGLPHFIAKSTLFERLPLRLVLRAFGVIPVYRRVDGGDLTENRSSFEEVRAALAKGRTVLIFPEGTVTDTQQLQRVRTGAARITLGAMAEGIENISIVPMGITYEDKVAARSRVLVEVGQGIDADAELAPLAEGGPVSENNRQLVRATTSLIRDELAAVSPEYGSLMRERVMMSAAAVHVRHAADNAYSDPPLSEIRSVAQSLANLPESESDPAIDAVGRYELALAAVGLRDDQINPPPQLPDLAGFVVRKAVIVLLIAPLAFVGLLANLIPTIIVFAVGVAIREPVTKGTARVLTAVVVYPLAWSLQIILVGPDLMWLTLAVMVVGGVLLVVLIQQIIELVEATVTYSSVRSRRWLLNDLAGVRAEADVAIVDALDASKTAL